MASGALFGNAARHQNPLILGDQSTKLGWESSQPGWARRPKPYVPALFQRTRMTDMQADGGENHHLR